MKKITISRAKLIACMSLGFFLGMGLGYIYGGYIVPRGGNGTANGPTYMMLPPEENRGPDNPEKIEDLVRLEDVSVDDDPALGAVGKAGTVTIVEFSDFQCTFCRDFFVQSFNKLKDEYVDTGKLRYVFRDFPLDTHPQAITAAIAANCAEPQGKYWEMHDLLFSRQKEWSYRSEAIQKFADYAAELKLNMDEWEKCTADEEQKYKAEIEHDLVDGVKYGVKSTPVFFINGKKVVGAQSTDLFRMIIDDEIAMLQAAAEE